MSITREHELFPALSKNGNVKFWGAWRRSYCEYVYVYVNGDLDSKGHWRQAGHIRRSGEADPFAEAQEEPQEEGAGHTPNERASGRQGGGCHRGPDPDAAAGEEEEEEGRTEEARGWSVSGN